MPDQRKPPRFTPPEALGAALATLDRVYDIPKQLLQVDITPFEQLDCVVFAYFDRDDVFYLNKACRDLLEMRHPTFDPPQHRPNPIFWLESDASLQATDEQVVQRQAPLLSARELVTLTWGKTWLQGAKFPIRSGKGQTLALLFAGEELHPSRQIGQVAQHYSKLAQTSGDN